ncbi:recombinase family protein [Leifsonia sp. AG29]|uniref:recombinase family protein n=1 Tax=Leifsonia sp. AG29 TaxID=2598860 RepID=UPI00131BD539|nr:recombinase family protein [Leifsonia sp. AG29]
MATFVDNGRSGGKERANAQAAYDMVYSGAADVLAVYAYDRWSRQGIEKAADVIRLVRERQESGHPALFFAEREGIRSDRDDWEMQLAFAADIAKKERDRTRARQIAARDRMRREGRNPGYGTPPLGYRTGPHPTLSTGRGLLVIPEEAEIIREIADRLVRGESTVKIGYDLTERGFPRARSKYRKALLAGDDPTGLDRGAWEPPRIRDTWISDHLLGRVSFKGAPVLDVSTGLPLTPFEPILDLETILKIRERFSAKRGEQRLRRAARLLSGVAYCGICDEKSYPKVSRGVPYYQCSGVARGKKCPQPRIDAALVESMVSDLYLAVRGDAPEVRVVEHLSDPETVALLATVSEQISVETARWAALDGDEADAVLATIGDLKRRRSELQAIKPRRTIEVVETGRTFAAAWADADTDGRRAMLLDALDHVSVYPRSNTDRVVAHWYEGIDQPEGHSSGPDNPANRRAPRSVRVSEL